MGRLLASALLLGFLAIPITAAQAQREARDRDRIPAEEIERSSAGTVHDLVLASRPSWIGRVRPTLNDISSRLLVFLDGAEMEGAESLKLIPARGVRVVEFRSPAQTKLRFGRGTATGAIAVYQASAPPRREGARGVIR